LISQDFLILQKLGNPVKSIQPPPPLVNVLDLLTRLDENGRSIFYALDRNDSIRAINEQYLYWDKAKYKVPPELEKLLSPAELWTLVKRDRRTAQKVISVAGQSFFFTPTDSLYKRLHEFDLNLGGTLGGQHELSDTDRHRFLIGSIMEESIASSQIEGAVTSRVMAKDMLRKSRLPQNTSERMILNNYLTINHIRDQKQQLLTPQGLLDLQRLITANTLNNPEEAGQFRQNDEVYVVDVVEGDIIHAPPTFRQLPLFVAELCQFFNDDTPTFFLHPVVKASLIHFLIGYFHPFADGNGRTARALFYWYLLRKGYWLTEYLSISRVIMQSRTQYYRAFQCTEADDNDTTYFVLYQAQTLHKAYEELKNYIARKTKQRTQLARLQHIDGLSTRQADMVQAFYEEPNTVFTVKEIETRFGISNQTARTDLGGLVDLGFAERIAVNRKEQRFVRSRRFDELLKPYLIIEKRND
jgi:Fic family protein